MQSYFCLNCKRPIGTQKLVPGCKCKSPDRTRFQYEIRVPLKMPSYEYYKSKILGKEMKIDTNYWINRGKIPIGTFHHPYSYVIEGSPYYCGSWEKIPEREICFIPFQPVNINMTQREALNIMLLAKSGGGKCVEENTRVITSDGRYDQIKDLPDAGEVVCINQTTLKNEIKPYIKKKNKKKMPCYLLKTQFGSEIISSKNHPYMTNNGWSELRNLKEGDFIALTRKIDYFGKTEMSENTVKILAYLIADGCLVGTNFNYTKEDKCMIAELSEAVKEYGCYLKEIPKCKAPSFRIKSQKKLKKYEINQVKSLCIKHNIFGKKSIDKTIPDEILSLPKKKLALFINRLISSDGSFVRGETHKDKKKDKKSYKYEIEYSSGNKELCLALKHLLLRFGIIAKVRTKHNKIYNRDYYILSLRNVTMVKRYLDEIGFFGKKEERVEEWYSEICKVKTNTNYDLTPIWIVNSYASRDRAKAINPILAESDIFWDRVKSIEYLGLRTTYDLQVADNENFIANDFTVHNSKLVKNIWFSLAKAGFWNVYIDPKSFDSGRARQPWRKSGKECNICPHIEPEGIQLQHYVPSWVIPTCEPIVKCKGNRFKFYEIKLSSMTEIEMWEGLGVGSGASKIVEIIKRYNQNRKVITLKILKREIQALDKEEINTNAKYDMLGKIDRIENAQIVGNNSMDFIKEFQKGNSVCISYNRADRIYMAFDIGMLIKKLSRVNQNLPESEKRPIMLYLDDGSMYLQKFNNGRGNFAMKETEYIGNNYRSLGLNNVMAVQGLSVVDEAVAEIYKWKIIDPLFPDVTQLSKIGIPYRAKELLMMNYLTIEPEEYISEQILINNKNEVVHFFPFIACPCGHLDEVYAIDNTLRSDEFD